MSEKTRGGDNVVPMNRGGKPPAPGGVPANPFSATQTEMERNAPVFKSREEYETWLGGKPTRRDVVQDVRKLWGAISHFYSVLESNTEAVEAMKKTLVQSGAIDPKVYGEYLTLQLNFKRLLDSINFVPNRPMPEKIQMVRGWNDEHKDMMIRGDYVKGLREFLADSTSGFTLMERAETASEVGIKEEEVLTEAELEELAKQLSEAPVTVAEAETDPEKVAEILTGVTGVPVGKSMLELEQEAKENFIPAEPEKEN